VRQNLNRACELVHIQKLRHSLSSSMDKQRDKQILEERLARCRKLAEDFRDGPTAEHIKELEAELLDDLRALDQ
jgi:hypothetical protein